MLRRARLPPVFLLLAQWSAAAPPPVHTPQPNPPQWPSSVHVFGPQDSPAQITGAVNQAFAENGGHLPIDHGQFSSSRFAFLFRPGVYTVDVPVGYYTQVLGLGKQPGDVIFDAPRGVHCEEGDQSDMGGSLSTFWRGAENFQTRSDMLWAVSQAAPVRRAIIDGDLNLAQFVPGVGMGYASGGFIANLQVSGVVNSASQQQFFARNAGINGGWNGGVWNMVFVGTVGAAASHCGFSDGMLPSTSVGTTPVVAEKPFLTIDAAGRYSLQVPPVQRGRVGPDFSLGQTVDFRDVYVAKDTDTAAIINSHLQQGLHVVLSPGIYHLEAPLELRRDNQVLLGLGLATLVPERGTAAVRVGDVDGVRIAGVLLQAGPGETDALLEWGTGAHAGSAENPGFLQDVFARVGGPNDPHEVQVRARVMVQIRSGHVVGDNLWLWRADHGVAGIVKGGMNPCQHGLVVTGPHVTMYGLAAEHTLQDIVQWAGDSGRTYFFQSELPYDVTQAFGDAGFVGYRVNDSVTTHIGYGIAVYHYFRDYAVTVQRGIAAPAWLENSFESPLAVSLTGKGTVLHVLNARGGPTSGDAQVSWSCSKGPVVPPAPVATTPTVRTTPVQVPPTTFSVAAVATTLAPMPPTTPTPAQGHGIACAGAWSKCGGRNWTGTTCCAAGSRCVEMGIWYSLCLPTDVKPWGLKQPPAPVPAPAVAPVAWTTPAAATAAAFAAPAAPCNAAWGRCGGRGWSGATCCMEAYECVEQSEWLSECIPASQAVLARSPQDTVFFKKAQLERHAGPGAGHLAPPGGSFLWLAASLMALQAALVSFMWRLHRRRAAGQAPQEQPGHTTRDAQLPLRPQQQPPPWSPPRTPGSRIFFRGVAAGSPSPAAASERGTRSGSRTSLASP